MPARLGQHFLINEGVRDAILAGARLEPGERVLEIGPGHGILTREILSRGSDVLAVEMDEALAGALGRELGPEAGSRLRLWRRDFLKLDLSELGAGPFKVVANLPYAVATPILQRVLAWPEWSLAVLMFQREVAERIAARPGSGRYGLLTLSVLLYAEAEVLLSVPREDFSPRPQVSSALVRLRRRERPLLDERDQGSFFRVARAAFGQRRKMAAGPIAAGLGLPRARVAEALESLGLKPTCRAEEIPFEAYLRMPADLDPRNASLKTGPGRRGGGA